MYIRISATPESNDFLSVPPAPLTQFQSVPELFCMAVQSLPPSVLTCIWGEVAVSRFSRIQTAYSPDTSIEGFTTMYGLFGQAAAFAFGGSEATTTELSTIVTIESAVNSRLSCTRNPPLVSLT